MIKTEGVFARARVCVRVFVCVCGCVCVCERERVSDASGRFLLANRQCTII